MHVENNSLGFIKVSLASYNSIHTMILEDQTIYAMILYEASFSPFFSAILVKQLALRYLHNEMLPFCIKTPLKCLSLKTCLFDTCGILEA